MDSSLPAASDDGDLVWSDSHSTDSDDIQGLPQSSSWFTSLSSTSTSASMSSAMSFAQTGQLSPISNGMDASYHGDSCCSSSSASASASPDLAHSAASLSSIGHWEMGHESHHGHGHHHELSWDPDSEDNMLPLPKLEPLDDDFCMDRIKEAPTNALSSSDGSMPDQTKTKRPRGRPRKHPIAPVVPANKVTKGRSKTGCLTCRKRKKKCDEAKPRCMNCEKNAVVCEGYPEKQIWKSGRERAEEGKHNRTTLVVGQSNMPMHAERLKSHSLPPITMQPLFHGLETVEDRIFWKHYNEHLSTVLTVEGEHKNAFKDMMVPIAVQHQGLMHSILSLASKHIDYDTPYGVNVLKNNPSTSVHKLHERSLYHHDQARQKFYEDVEVSDAQDKLRVSARYGQMLCFLLEALAEGNPRGEHRLHLSAYKSLISSSPPEDSAFFSFIAEFFQYHIFADELIHSVSSLHHRAIPNDANHTPAIHTPRLLGVADGLLEYLPQISMIRNTIRHNIVAQVDPVVDYVSLYRAAEIDAAIKDWTPHWPRGDNRDRVGLLYKHMMWIYLVRTVYPPTPSALLPSTGTSVLPFSTLSIHGGTGAAGVTTPPMSASPSCTSSPKLEGMDYGMGSVPVLSTASSRAQSPRPSRKPLQHDPRITLAVQESLAIMESFKPSDPCQTLLLLPCFIVGTACFTTAHQDRVRAALKTVKGYTSLRNADRTLEVLEHVWQLMESGDWAAVWDWPRVAQGLGLDFIPA
ncbi:fungal-specific transcription factor domain-containing protein [Sordaria brevicollis]|uniref:Fungal-specific transcription factor domain-containing protein n=1 Tax=Sordaria brevicollis TaxID=83679 RepID=A0AAE0PIG6_SORBR|nr:fungal-specific transcription factor domain-containing protein [Sordaria brevicollis]